MMTLSVIGLSSSKTRLEPIGLSVESEESNAVISFQDWAQENGFEWIDAYWGRFPMGATPFISAWENPNGTMLAVYRVVVEVENEIPFLPSETIDTGYVIDFVTDLDPESSIGITTGNSEDAGSLPSRPTSFVECFPGMAIDKLFLRHNETIAFLGSRLDLYPVRSDRPFEVVFLDAIQQQAKFVRSHFLWPFRCLVWYFRRKRFHGIAVSQRYANITPADLPR